MAIRTSILPHIHNCTLTIPVWNKNSERDRPHEHAPTLIFSRAEGSRTIVLATVALAVSEWRSPGPSRWMVWCPDPSHYIDYDDYDDGFNIMLHGRGEAHPRDTAKTAIDHALSRLGDQLSGEDRSSLVTVAEMLRPILERASRAFETRFRRK